MPGFQPGMQFIRPSSGTIPENLIIAFANGDAHLQQVLEFALKAAGYSFDATTKIWQKGTK